MPGIGDSWGTREELLHPRDKNGRFRTKWKMAKSVVDAIIGFLDKFNPRTFGSDGQSAQYAFNLANKAPKLDLRRFSADFSQTNKALQAGEMDPSTKKYVDMMDRSLIELPDDLILSRVTGPENFGLTAETMHLDEGGIEDFTSRLVANRGYTSFNVGTPLTQAAGPGKIKIVMATPKGTKVVVPGRSPADREIVPDHDQEMRITKVTPDGTGGYFMLAVATDRTPGKTPESIGVAPGGDQQNLADREARVTNLAQAQSRQYGQTGDVGGTMEGVAERQAQQAQQPQAPAPPGTPPPRTEPIVSPAVGGPSVPEAPGAAAPGAAPGAPDSGPRLVNIRRAVQDANLPSPSRGKRRAEWNDAYLGLARGKKDPGDILRELQRDIDVNKRILSDNKAAGDDSDREYEADIKAQEQLRDLIEKEYGFQDADEQMRRDMEEETAAEFEGEQTESVTPTAPKIAPVPAPAKKATPAVKRTAAGLPKQEGLTPVKKAVKSPISTPEPGERVTLAHARRLAAMDAVRENKIEGTGVGGYRNISQNLENGTWTVPRARQEALKSAKYWRTQGDKVLDNGRATPEQRREANDRLNKIAGQYDKLAEELTVSQSVIKTDKYVRKATPAKKAAPVKKVEAGPKTVDTMTKVELLAEAKRQGVDVRQSWTKDKIKTAIGEGPKAKTTEPLAKKAVAVSPEESQIRELFGDKKPTNLQLRNFGKEWGVPVGLRDSRSEMIATILAERERRGGSLGRAPIPGTMGTPEAEIPEATPEDRVKALFNGKRPTNTQLLNFAQERGVQVDPKNSRGELILTILGQTELRRGQARELVPQVPAPAPVKAAKTAVPGAAPGTAAGKITVSRLRKGSRILVSRDSKGEWSHATKKTGATPLTVDEINTVGAGRRGFSQRAVFRRQIVGHDDNGNQITVSSLAPAQTVMAAPDLKASLVDQIQGKTPDEMARILGGPDVTTKDLKQVAQDLDIDTARVSPRGSVRQPAKKSEWITAIIQGNKRPTVTGPSPEDAARTRQGDIDVARKRAIIGGELAQLVGDGASTPALLNRLDTEARASGVADDPDFAKIRAAAEAGDPAGAKRLADAWMRKNSVTQVGAANNEETFDPKQHQVIGTRPEVGARVRTIRPGFMFRRDGEEIQLSKAIVEPIDVKAETLVPKGSVPGPRTETPIDNKPRKREFGEAWKAADIQIPDGLPRRSTNEVIDRISKGEFTPEEGIRRLETDVAFNKEDLAEKDAVLRGDMSPAERRDLIAKAERLEEAIKGQEEASKFLRLYFADEKPSVPEVKESIKAEDPKTFRDMLKDAKPDDMKEAAKLSGLKDPKGSTSEEMFDDLIKQVVEKELASRQAKKATRAVKKAAPAKEVAPAPVPSDPTKMDAHLIAEGLDVDQETLNQVQRALDGGEAGTALGKNPTPAAIGRDLDRHAQGIKTHAAIQYGAWTTRGAGLGNFTPEEQEQHRLEQEATKLRLYAKADAISALAERLKKTKRPAKKAAPANASVEDFLARMRSVDQRDEKALTDALNGATVEQLKQIGEGLNMTVPASVKTAPAIRLHIAQGIRGDHLRTRGHRDPGSGVSLEIIQKHADELESRLLNGALERLRNAKTRRQGEDAVEGLTAQEMRRLVQQAGLPPQRTKALNRDALIDRFVQLPPAGTVRAEGYSTAANTNLRVVADGRGGYIGQRQNRSSGEWLDDPSLGTGNTPRDITSRRPNGQWRMVAPPAPGTSGTAPDTSADSAKEQADKLRKHAQVTRQLAGMRLANNPKGSSHHTRGLADEKEADRLDNEADRLDPPEHLRDLPAKKVAKKAATPAVTGTSPVAPVTQESLRDLPTREAGYDALKGMNKKQLVDLARTLSVPGAANLNMSDLRREIVEGTTGRRLDSIATRGFTGGRPGQGDVAGRPDLPTGRSPATPVRRHSMRDTPGGRLPTRERPNADEPLQLPNNGNDQGKVHMDSQLGRLWWDLYQDDREPNSFVNEIAKIGEDVGTGALPLDQALNRLKAMKGRSADSAVADRIQDAIDEMEAPPVELPDFPDSVPSAVQEALAKLANIPTARKPNIPGQSERRSALESKIDVVRRIDSGEIGRMSEAERLLEDRTFHESVDGALEMWRIFEILTNPNPIVGYERGPDGKPQAITEPNPGAKEIRDWIMSSRKKRS